ncbi:hypothetical protein [Sinimarinibacterium thermocellulolyticum]|uniref:Outer membrane protein beta-barrel domain-containing protein n=1 Tax=Sinimarinibacterium thermocellulolyticum TaxID=3170016 RepID=A0ABV2ADI6_9GAMM
MRASLASLILLVAADGAHAAGSGAAGLRLGSGGISAEYAHPLSERFAVRGAYSFGTLGLKLDENGVDYDADLRYRALLAAFDLRPFTGGFRVSAGVWSRPPDIALRAQGENQRIPLGAREYTASGRIDGDVDLGSAAPFLGIGWGGGPAGRGFGLSFEAGVMFADAPGVSLRAEGRACDSTLFACNPDGLSGFDVNDPADPRAQAFRNELENEERALEEDLDGLRYFPVVNLGLHYRF